MLQAATLLRLLIRSKYCIRLQFDFTYVLSVLSVRVGCECSMPPGEGQERREGEGYILILIIITIIMTKPVQEETYWNGC
jgi:hypothetical protein